MTDPVDDLKQDAMNAIKELEAASYDRPAIFRFAKAAKSWCERDSREWKLWEIVIETCSQ